MYIKLGTIQEVRQYDDPNDFMILSEVPSSSMSYESPTRVRSLDELNIWFGKDYPEYDHLCELIEMGITLYLYKPVSPSFGGTEGWEDVYFEENLGFSGVEHLEETFPSGGEEGKRYHVGDDQVYIWYVDPKLEIGSWIEESDSPEETPVDSLGNRDTLVVSKSIACKPRYIKDGEFEKKEDPELVVADGEGTYSTTLRFASDTLGEGHLGFQDSFGSWILCYSGDLDFTVPSDTEIHEIEDFGDLEEVLSRYYTVEKSDESWNLRTSDRREPVTFNSYASLIFSENIEENESLIYGSISEDEGYVGLWSKTIGRDRNEYDVEESRIKVDIENLGSDGWKIEISRYGYSEYWIGPLQGKIGEEGILDRIEKESKLVHLEVFGNPDELLEGSWYLEGAEVETPSAMWYRNSMVLLLGTLEDSVYPDFFMIPDLSLYGERQDKQLFLPFAVAGNLQYLIHETGEEYKENYIEDKENRLLYFYGNIFYNGQKKPGWWLYLQGLLRNNRAYQNTDILYGVRLNQVIECGDESWEVHNPYITLEQELDQYKCNYLVWNNQYYYYNKFQNGPDYETSGTMRFIIGKVYREIQKNRWRILGRKYNTLIRNSIEQILQNVSEFDSVQEIRITKYYPLLEISTIDLEVEVYTKELLKNDVTLDITINYKKYGN